jgi:hypothetical protein
MTPEAIVSDMVDLINRATRNLGDQIPPELLKEKGTYDIAKTLIDTTFYWNDSAYVIEAWSKDRMIHVLHPKQGASLLAGIIDILSDVDTLKAVTKSLEDQKILEREKNETE